MSHGNAGKCNADKKCMWSHKHHHCMAKGGHTDWKMIGIILGSVVGVAVVAFLIWFLVTKYGGQ